MTQLKTLALAVAILSFSASLVHAQKKPERPRVHTDFYFGSYPSSRDALELMAKENSRLLLVGFHAGWDVEKIAKEFKRSPDELNKLYDELEEAQLAGNRSPDDDVRPMIPVIRERDTDRLKDSIGRQAEDFSKLLVDNWAEIESTVSSLPGAKDVPKPQLMYQVIVSAILLAGMDEVFTEDKTLMFPAPRRLKSQRFYGWLVEGDPSQAGTLKREVRESDAYSIVSIGDSFPQTRVTIEQIRAAHGLVLEVQEARRFRSFISVLCRDKLLPFFKGRRAEFLKVAGQVEFSRYAAFGEFFAWYYNRIAHTVTARLVAAGRIAAPADQYTYALKLP